jgi:hypothetical protein
MKSKLYKKATHAIRYWLLRKLPTCKDTSAIMSQSLDRRLTLRERVTMKLHLWVCIWCVWYLEQLHIMRAAARARAAQLDDEEPASTASLSTAARARLKRRISDKEQ